MAYQKPAEVLAFEALLRSKPAARGISGRLKPFGDHYLVLFWTSDGERMGTPAQPYAKIFTGGRDDSIKADFRQWVADVTTANGKAPPITRAERAKQARDGDPQKLVDARGVTRDAIKGAP